MKAAIAVTRARARVTHGNKEPRREQGGLQTGPPSDGCLLFPAQGSVCLRCWLWSQTMAMATARATGSSAEREGHAGCPG